MGFSLMDLFKPTVASTAGTPRVDRIATEPWDTQIRNAGQSVMAAMLTAGEAELGSQFLASDTGQATVQATAQAQAQKYAIWILIGAVVLFFMFGRASVGRR